MTPTLSLAEHYGPSGRVLRMRMAKCLVCDMALMSSPCWLADDELGTACQHPFMDHMACPTPSASSPALIARIASRG